MCDKEQLVAYLYDDIGDADRAAVERHLQSCAECRGELRALRELRGGLARWAPPQPDLGYHVVRDRAPSWHAWWTPAFGLAAAAVLVLAAAAALAHVEVRYGQGGVSIRTGWGAAPAPVTAQMAAPAEGVSARQVSALEDRYAAIDRRLADLEASAQAAPSSPVRQTSAASARQSDAEVLARVKALLVQSESRQQQQLALRIAQVLHDVDAQRVADLTRIQQGLGRIDMMTTAEAAAHRDLANYIMASTKQK
jgi:hypothetical protein